MCGLMSLLLHACTPMISESFIAIMSMKPNKSRRFKNSARRSVFPVAASLCAVKRKSACSVLPTE